MIVEQRDAGLSAQGRRTDLRSEKPQVDEKVTLKEVGVDENLAHHARLLVARLPVC